MRVSPFQKRLFLGLGIFWIIGLFMIGRYIRNLRPIWDCEDPKLNICQCPTQLHPFEMEGHPRKYVEEWCPRIGNRIAVFIPFFGECERISASIERWGLEDFFPCSDDEQISPSVDLIFSSGLSPSNPNKCDVIISKKLPKVERCFRSILFYHDDLESEDHDRGSRYQFWKALERFYGVYSFVFLMESDTHPIRSNWVGKLQKESWCGDDFVVKGSQFRRANRNQVADVGIHINGNALYNLNTTHSGWILDMVQVREKAYDAAMGQMLLDPYSAKQSRELIHLYRYSDFIQNVFHKSRWNSYSMANRFPNTFFVHGKTFKDDPNDPIPFIDLESSGYWAEEEEEE